MNSLPFIHLITGYLGSGKTLFIQQLLQRRVAGGRIAVIVNDFGDLVYDGFLLRPAEQQFSPAVQVVDVPGGCLCCSAVEDFRLALSELVQAGYTRIIIEATGLADTAQVRADLAYLGFPVESLLCLVDCLNTLALEQTFATLREQIRAADVLLFSKKDLVSEAQFLQIQHFAQTLNSRAARIILNNGVIHPDDHVILFAPPEHFTPHYHPAQQHFLRDSISACRLVFPHPVPMEMFQSCSTTLPTGIVRIKGLLVFGSAEEQDTMVVQSVCGRWDFTRVADVSIPVSLQSAGELFCIGQNIDVATLQQCFSRCHVRLEKGTIFFSGKYEQNE